ncbi:MAG: hypothetical protein H8D35_03395 [Nitrosopumilus sp.]|nr:hypothetical protein [Nitrosopumilus sp.]MBL7015014.1 hypothetical protein [Nitrosopumilus sp.]
MSSTCRGECVDNREGIKFVHFRQTRYKDGMGCCVKCEKGWHTDQRLCHCCSNKMRYNRRAKK